MCIVHCALCIVHCALCIVHCASAQGMPTGSVSRVTLYDPPLRSPGYHGIPYQVVEDGVCHLGGNARLHLGGVAGDARGKDDVGHLEQRVLDDSGVTPTPIGIGDGGAVAVGGVGIDGRALQVTGRQGGGQGLQVTGLPIGGVDEEGVLAHLPKLPSPKQLLTVLGVRGRRGDGGDDKVRLPQQLSQAILPLRLPDGHHGQFIIEDDLEGQGFRHDPCLGGVGVMWA